MEKVFIYGLWDPRNYSLRYVGKTDDLELRLRQHINFAANGQKSHKSNWIRQLLAEGLTPSIEALEEVSRDDWQRIEKIWIAECLENGLKLTNMTQGGDGFTGEHSETSKQKTSRALMGIPKGPMSEETKEKLRKSSMGNKNSVGLVRSEETKEKIRQTLKGNIPWNKGIPCREETKEKLRKKNSKYRHTEEAKKKISKAGEGNQHGQGCKHTEEHKEKMRVRMSGEHNPFFDKTHSPETIQKIKETKARNKARAEKSLDQEEGQK